MPIQQFITVAKQYEAKEPIVSFYVYMHAMQSGMGLAKGDKSAKGYLGTLIDRMEGIKKHAIERDPSSKEAFSDDTVGQAHLEDAALKLFALADNQDRAGNFHKNMIKQFYTSSFLFGALTQFGELSEDIIEKQKYAKYKAADIARCLKNGIQPTAGPPGGDDTELSVPQPAPIGFGGYDPSSAPQGTPYAVYPEGGVETYTPPQPTHPHPPPGSVPVFPPADQSSPVPKPRTHLPPQNDPPAPTPMQPQQPITPQVQQPLPTATPILQPGSITIHPGLTFKEYSQASKYCRYASSALDYEDAKTAINNLTKALRLLQTGRDE